jgi:hypothetical protein
MPAASLSIIEVNKPPDLVPRVEAALQAALTGRTTLDPAVLEMSGMSGRLYRIFINTLIGSLAPDARYLEIGVWQGSTLCSAISGNRAFAVAIDNWSEFGGPREECLANVNRYAGESRVLLIESDLRKVNYPTLPKSNVFLYDGPHEEIDQIDGIVVAQPALDAHYALIVDDWNLPQVRSGTFEAIERLGLEVPYMAQIRTSLDDKHPDHHSAASEWHNGYMIAVVHKRLESVRDLCSRRIAS